MKKEIECVIIAVIIPGFAIGTDVINKGCLEPIDAIMFILFSGIMFSFCMAVSDLVEGIIDKTIKRKKMLQHKVLRAIKDYTPMYYPFVEELGYIFKERVLDCPFTMRDQYILESIKIPIKEIMDSIKKPRDEITRRDIANAILDYMKIEDI